MGKPRSRVTTRCPSTATHRSNTAQTIPYRLGAAFTPQPALASSSRDYSIEEIRRLAERCREFIAAYVKRGEIIENAHAFLTSVHDEEAIAPITTREVEDASLNEIPMAATL